MKRIKFQQGYQLGKNELKSIIGGDITHEECSCTLKSRNAFGVYKIISLDSNELLQVAQSSSVESCVAVCASLCQSKSDCKLYAATYDASGHK